MTERISQTQTERTTANAGLRRAQSLALLVLLSAGLTAAAQDDTEQAPAIEPLELENDSVDAVPEFVIPPDPKNEWLDAIDRIEEEFGPYDGELSELYLGLGEAYLKEGDLEAARDAYHRGIMVVRVNSGPNSPEQSRLLYLIANIETFLGNPDSADEILETVRFINMQHHGEDSPELIPVYEQLIGWYQTVRPLDVNTSEFNDFARMVDLTEQLAHLNETAYGPRDPRTANAWRAFAEAHFQVLRFEMNVEDWVDPRLIVARDTAYQSLMGEPEVSPRTHYIEGREAFQKYLDLTASDRETSPLQYAEQLADFADWSLIFEKYRASRRLYSQAWDLLVRSQGYAGLAERYFGEPRPMKFTGLPPRPADDALEDPDAILLDVSMTVTRMGHVRDIEFPDPPDGLNGQQLRNIQEQLYDAPFRPRLVNGRAETTDHFLWRHVVYPSPPEADETGSEEIAP